MQDILKELEGFRLAHIGQASKLPIPAKSTILGTTGSISYYQMQPMNETLFLQPELVPKSLQVDSPAKTSAKLTQPEPRALMEPEVAFGMSSTAIFAVLDPLTLSWKTAQCSYIEDWPPSLHSLPLSGTMRNGKCYQSERLVSRMRGKDFLSLPTPTKSDGMRIFEFSIESLLKRANKKSCKLTTFNLNLVEWAVLNYGVKPSPDFYRAMMGFPPDWLVKP